MGVVTKTFKSGNSVAVRIPAEFGISEGVEVEVEKVGSEVTIRTKPKRTMAELVRRLREIGPPADGVQPREKIIFPKRRGL